MHSRRLFLVPLQLLLLIVSSRGTDLFSNLALSGANPGQSLDQCVEISSARPCASMPWNMTIFPNLLGHTRAEGKIHLHHFSRSFSPTSF